MPRKAGGKATGSAAAIGACAFPRRSRTSALQLPRWQQPESERWLAWGLAPIGWGTYATTVDDPKRSHMLARFASGVGCVLCASLSGVIERTSRSATVS